MADEVVGSVYVVIRAIADKIREDIKDGVKGVSDDSELDKTGEDIGDKVGESAGERVGEHITENISEKVKKDQNELGKVGEDIGSAIGDPAGKRVSEHITEHVKVDVDKNRNEFDRVGHDLGDAIAGGFTRGGVFSKIGSFIGSRVKSIFTSSESETEKAAGGWGNKMGTKLGKGFGDAIHGIPMMPVLATMLVPAAGGVLQLLSSYVASAISLVSSLGPALAGSGVAAIGTYAAVYQGIGAVTLALKTQSPYLKAFQKQMKALKPDLKALGVAVQQTLLPKLSADIKTIAGNLLPLLKRRLAETGSSVAAVAGKLTKLTGSDFFKGRLSTVMGTNNKMIRLLGGALVHLVSLLVTLLAAARPVILMFGRWVNHLLKVADASAKAGTESGKLQGFFKRAAASMHQWGDIIGNFGKAFFNIMKIASKSGQTLTDGIQKLSKRFLDFTKSAKGKNQIATFFKNAIPIVRAFNKLIGAVFKALGSTLGNQKGPQGVVKVINTIRTQALPGLIRILHTLSTMGPGLSNLFTTLSKTFNQLAKSGALSTFTKTLNIAFKILNKLLQIPGVGHLLEIAVGFAGIAKALDLITFGGSSKLFGILGGQVGKLVEKVSGGSKPMELFAGVLKKLGGGILGLAKKFIPILLSALRGLFTFMLTNPIGILILALVALGVGIYELIKHWGAVKKFMIGLWHWIKGVFGPVWDWLKGKFEDLWNGIKHVFSAGIDFVKKHWRTFLIVLLAILTGPVGAIVGYVVTHWNKIKNITVSVWNKIRNITKAVWNWLKSHIVGVVTSVATHIRTWFTKIWNTIKTAWNNVKKITQAVWNWLLNHLVHIVTSVANNIRNGFNRIKNWISNAWNWVKNTTANLWNKIVNAVQNGVSKVIGWVKGLPDKIKSFFSNAGSWLLNAGENIMRGLVNGIGNGFNWVKDKLGSLTSKLTSWKGPPSRDRKLLTGNGQLIIQSLMDGFDNKTSELRKNLSGITSMIASSTSGLSADVSVGMSGAGALGVSGANGLNAAGLAGQRQTTVVLRVGEKEFTGYLQNLTDNRILAADSLRGW